MYLIWNLTGKSRTNSLEYRATEILEFISELTEFSYVSKPCVGVKTRGKIDEHS